MGEAGRVPPSGAGGGVPDRPRTGGAGLTREPGPGGVSSTTWRVSYEETDAAGVVYYGNYLRFFERGRTEHLRSAGVSVRDLADRGYLFPVVRVEVDYRAPAAYDDLLCIESEVAALGRASVTYRQRVLRDGDRKLLCEGVVTLACVDKNLKPRRMPVEVQGMGPRKTGREGNNA